MTAGVLMLVGCAGDDDGGNQVVLERVPEGTATTEEPTTTTLRPTTTEAPTTTTPVRSGPVDVCAVVPDTQVQAVLGDGADQGTAGTLGGNGNACVWSNGTDVLAAAVVGPGEIPAEGDADAVFAAFGLDNSQFASTSISSSFGGAREIVVALGRAQPGGADPSDAMDAIQTTLADA